MAEDGIVSGIASYFGTFDLVVIAMFLAGAFYWYKKKKDEQKTQYEFNAATGGGTTLRLVRQTSDTGFVAKMRQTNRNVAVFYGSQTGTAEDLANRLAKDATRYGMKGVALDPEECEMDDLGSLKDMDNNLVIFCMATYGEGDPTDNAQEFFDLLQRDELELEGVNYAVFALGNKTYEHYNDMGKFVDKRFEELGANRICELGLGDDDGNLEEDFMLWRETFWPSVCDFYKIESVADEVSMRQYELVVHEDYPPEKVFIGEISRLKSFERQRPPYDAKNPYLSPVAVNSELHACGDRSCRHIEFDISNGRMRYDAGDHLGVYPINDSDLISRLVTRLKVDLGTVFSLNNLDESSTKKHPFPCPTTYETALKHYVDIATPVRMNVLKELIDYCSDDNDKELLKSMTSITEESRSKYHNWVMLDHRCIADVLEDVPSCNPPLDHLLELLPRLQPRYYSISSSPKHKQGVVAITAVVLLYTTRVGRDVKGVATNYLAAKLPHDDIPPTVPIFTRKSTLRLPNQPKTPVIMIGPGTGLAPFRGFIQERAIQLRDGKPVGNTIFYFGCRHEKEDYIYREELEQYKNDGVLTELRVAFSRDGPSKVYVQHLLGDNAAETWQLLEQGGHVYVCGDARNMARDVRETIEKILVEHGGKTMEQAVAYVKKMETQRRYQQDVWT